MPRVSLSQAEKRLMDLWKISAAYQKPRLFGLWIQGNDGIRGIKNLEVNLDHPITVICGSNGCGKSTIMSLSRLGFQQAIQFDDLFLEVNNPDPFHDFSVNWYYEKHVPVRVEYNGTAKTYSSPLPEKPVVFIGLSRLVPAWEKAPMVSHFREERALDNLQSLEQRNITRLRDIMNRPFTGANWGISGGYEIRTCSTNKTYTSFNMGTGEEILVEIIRLLQAAEPESLILIEDAEVGLNPVVMPRFARNLVDICLEKRLQILLTTHSLDFITSFPSEFVCLIKWDGVSHQSKNNPEMQEIFTNISAQLESDIIIFCEDDIAESLIRQAVSGDLRRRLKIVYGSKTKLLGYAEAHLKAGWPHIPIIVWDGDVSNAEVNEWLKKLDKITSDELNAKVSRLKLPGSEPPEVWILSQLLNSEDGCRLLAEELNDDEQTTRAFLGMLSTMAAFHSLPFELANRTGLDEKAVLRSLTKTIGRLTPNPLTTLQDQVERAAKNEVILAV